jgi:hypothetical protein
MALTANRDTREIVGALVRLAVKAGKTLYAGALAAIDSDGYAVPASDASGLKVIGRAEHQAQGGQSVLIKRGVFLYKNKAGDLVAAAHIGGYCYVSDDETVQGSANTNSIIAGVVRGVTSEGVYVDTEWYIDGAAAATAGASAGTTSGAAAVAAAGNVRLVDAPAAANSDGVKGDIATDGTYLYLCTGASTWVRAALALATWGA